MRDEDKPFICYRQSRWAFTISPRNGAGWRAMALWFLPFALLTAGFVYLSFRLEHAGAADRAIIPYLIGYVLLTIAWSIAMVRWMMARSVIIDAEDVLAWKREQERQRQRGRR